MKYPYTGLFAFCEQLSMALVRNQSLSKGEISFYVPEKQVGFAGNQIQYHIQQSWHKFFNPIHGKSDLWHGTYQGSRYFPSNNKIKKVLTIHDLNFLVEQKKSEAKQKKLLDKVKRQVEHADHITAISQFTLDFISRHIDLSHKPVDVIYNGCHIDLERDIPQKPGFITDDKPFLFSIGTIAEKKNFHVLVPLLKGNDYKLIVAGIYQQSTYVEKIKEEAKKHGVSDRVILPSSVTTNEKWWLMKDCTAFVFPSIAEGFGIPVVEAMYFEKPLLLSTHTCLPEIGGDAAYYFDDFNPENMQQKLNETLHDFSISDEKKLKMRERKNLFNWNHSAVRYIEIYNKTLGF
jgi:glycosyltransferase involved in cell wall biosynthesis